MADTTITTSNTSLIQQFDDCKTMMDRMKAIMHTTAKPEWVLIAPDGRVWQGEQCDVARVLLQNIDLASLFAATQPQAQEGKHG